MNTRVNTHIERTHRIVVGVVVALIAVTFQWCLACQVSNQSPTGSGASQGGSSSRGTTGRQGGTDGSTTARRGGADSGAIGRQGWNGDQRSGPGPTAKDADTSKYTPLQKKAVEIVGKAKRITQFLDRDTRADFAGPEGMQGFLQKFLKDPSGDLAALQKTIQDYWDHLPPLA
jgi:hypothetical protein